MLIHSVRRVVFLCMLALLGGAFSAHATEGLYLLGTDALQLGRADGGTASPRSAFWMIMNPAAISELDKRLDLSFYAVRDHVVINPAGVYGYQLEGSLPGDGFGCTPGGGMVLPLKDGKGTLGLGIYPISGGTIGYEASRSILGKLYGNKDRRMGLQHGQLAVSYAYEFENGWAVGAGVQASLTRFHTDQITTKLRPTKGDNEWDDALGIGFNLGVYKRWDTFSVGASFKSRQWCQPFDKYDDLIVHGAMDYPHTFRAGIAWRPFEPLTLNLDYEFQYWKGIPMFNGPMLESGLEWDNMHGFKAGVEYKVTDRVTLMSGYSFGSSVVGGNHVFLNALSPSFIKHHASFGLSYAITPQSVVHAVYLRSFKNKMTDTGDGDVYSRLAGGSEVLVSGDAVAVGFSYLFSPGKS